jgi:hypothetical protein
MKDKKGLGLGVVAIIGLGLWAWLKSKPAAAGTTPAAATPTATTPATTTPTPITTTPKTTTTDKATMPLEVWQQISQAKVEALPVTKNTGIAGAETYYKTSQPIAIGNTGFNIYGVTESGAAVISQNDPSTYPAWEWY